MNPNPTKPHPSRPLVLAAFAIVYLVWGSTYLGMRVAIQTLPPFLMAGCRFIIAGGLLFAWLVWRGVPVPAWSDWRNAAISGFFLLVTCNGPVAWVEQTVPSGIAALLVGLTPAWFALVDWWRPGGTQPKPRTMAGIVVGFAGIFLLVSPQASAAHGTTGFWSTVILLFAGFSWAAGSLFSKHYSRVESPWMNAAMQMLCGGVALLFIALFTGEFTQMGRAPISAASLAALGYLIVFGSWAGFSAYVWLLKVSEPSHVATYAYVNPIVAIVLGRIVLGEPITWRVLWAGAVILAGVVIITLPKTALSGLGQIRRRSMRLR